MKKIMQLIVISLILVITACGSSGGGDSTPATFNWSPGILSGTFTPNGGSPEDVALIVTSTNQFAIANIDGSDATIGTVSGSTLTATGGYTATLTAALSGTYSGAGVTGTFSLVDAGLYGRTSSTAKLNGVWVDTFYTTTTGITTWTIDAAGVVAMASVSGCAATGNINTINASNNEYSLALQLTNCPGFDGAYAGFGFTDDDSFTDDVFAFVVENAALQTFGIFAPIKQ